MLVIEPTREQSDVAEPDAAGDLDEADEADGAPAADARVERPAGSRRRWPVLLAVALVAALGFAAVLLLGGDDDGDDDLERVASSFAERLLTFEPEGADASIESVLELSAGEFEENYAAAAEAGLAEVLERAGTESTARAGRVFVGPVDGDEASVVVEVDVERSTTAIPEVSFTTYLRLDLVDDDGWAVVDVSPLEESGSTPVLPGDAEEPATTTVPGG